MSTIAALNDALSGRYEISKEIGQGGMATVYLARDHKHDRDVAIKVLHPELAAILGSERFVTEMKVTANLQHPHILPLFDSGTAHDQLFYVMPFVDGESLRDRLDREQQLSIEDAVRVASEVGSALDYAHRHGVVHRDIKPENILLHDGSALVADFGIALAISNSGGTRLTQTGLSLGTPQYMSPEQATGERTVDGRSDTYSLGCVLYEMLMGEPPFTGPNSQAIVARVLTERVQPLRPRRPTVSVAIERAVHQATQKLPADRFATAAAFVESLRVTERSAVEAPAQPKRESLSPRGRDAVVVTVAGIVAIAAAFQLGQWRAGGAQALHYEADQVGGPRIASEPRIAPDGRTIAFTTPVHGQSQVGVLNPSGDWRLLTHDTTRGAAQSLSWSPDGSRIFFTRYVESRSGVYTVPSLGGEEQLVLDDAEGAHPLADGSLIAWRFDSTHTRVMVHFSPETGKLDTLRAYTSSPMAALLPNGTEVAFVGAVSRPWTADTLYVLNLATGKSRFVATDLGEHDPGNWYVFTATPDGAAILFARWRYHDHVVTSIPLTGAGKRTDLFLVIGTILTLEADRNGDVILEELVSHGSTLRYQPATRHVDVEPMPEEAQWGAWPLPDGRLLTFMHSDAGDHAITVAASGEPTQFFSDPTANEPIAWLGRDRVLVRTGRASSTMSPSVRYGTAAALSIVDVATGHVVGQVRDFPYAQFAGSPDGTTLFFADSGAIWSMPAAGGSRKRLHSGFAVAIDPHGKYLVIQEARSAVIHLVHFPLDGGAPSDIPVRDPIASFPITAQAVAEDGRISLCLSLPRSSYWQPAIYDPRTRATEVIPIPDVHTPVDAAWMSDGSFVATLWPNESQLFRYRLVRRTGRR